MIFDFKSIHKRIGITGVIHVGGFIGEELEVYRDCGLKNTIMFEPQPNLATEIDNKMIESEEVVCCALGCETKEKEQLYISTREGGIFNGSGASSSLLKPALHLTEHPEVGFSDSIEVCVDTLDNWIDNNLEIKDLVRYNFMNIDVQGYELNVLKGAEKFLDQVKGLIVEVNRDEVYRGCAKVWEIDDFLSERGFKQTELVWQSKSWGDALYEKD